MGMAEADVTKAKGTVNAANTETQADAEAAGVQARGLAEAKSIEEKAKAMKLLHEAGQQHEEFRLRLNKERDVELAAINVQRDVAQANAAVVSEALKTAKIDIVGGENDFFEKIVRAVGNGKSVDRMVNNSETLSDIKNTFFNGDPDFFKSQLAQWVKDFGIKTEDLKNLTIAALLGKMIASSKDSSLQSVLKSAHAMAKESGLADVMASTVLLNQSAKV
jgi:hypothetical protein